MKKEIKRIEATHKTVEEKWAEEKGLPPEELKKDYSEGEMPKGIGETK